MAGAVDRAWTMPFAEHGSIAPTAPPGYHPDIGELVAYWRRIHPAAGLPGRRHFDPADIPALLPHIWLMDVFRAPWRFRIRLVGTAVVAFSGRDTTGRWCDEAFPGFEQSEAYIHIVECAERGVPTFCTARLLVKNDHRLSQRVHLPLAADGRTVDVILSLTRYVLPAGTPLRRV